MKSFLISASLIAIGVVYFYRVIEDRSHANQSADKPPGEIVVAHAPDGTIRGRWQSSTPIPGFSK